MKHILTSAVLVVLLFPALALSEEVPWDDLVKTDGLYYKKFTDVPFTEKTQVRYKEPTRTVLSSEIECVKNDLKGC